MCEYGTDPQNIKRQIKSMGKPFPKKFFYEEQSYHGSHYLIEWVDGNRLNIQDTSPCIPFLLEPPSFTTPTEKQWRKFEEKLQLIELETLHDEHICDGTWICIWITFKRRVKLSIQLGEYEKLKPLHLALNPLTKCREYPRGLFFQRLSTQ